MVPYLFNQAVPYSGVSIPIYLVGWSYKGPEARSVLVRSVDEADRVFGGVVEERFDVAPDTTYRDLLLPACSEGYSFEVVDGGFRLTDVLVRSDLGFKRVQFSATPASGTIRFRYRPYPGSYGGSYLPILVRHVFAAGADRVVCVRVPGGSAAKASVSGWTFEASEPGGWYNTIVVTIESGRLTVRTPDGLDWSVSVYSNLSEWVRELNAGGGPVRVTAFTDTLPSPTTLTLTGGDSAVLSDPTLLHLAQLWEPELPGVVLVPMEPVSGVAESFYLAMRASRSLVVYPMPISKLGGIDG